MKTYLAFLEYDLRVSVRNKRTVFLSYILPVGAFLFLAELFRDRGGDLGSIFNMSVVIGLMGNGLWGAALRGVSDRETDVLRLLELPST